MEIFTIYDKVGARHPILVCRRRKLGAGLTLGSPFAERALSEAFVASQGGQGSFTYMRGSPVFGLVVEQFYHIIIVEKYVSCERLLSRHKNLSKPICNTVIELSRVSLRALLRILVVFVPSKQKRRYIKSHHPFSHKTRRLKPL